MGTEIIGWVVLIVAFGIGARAAVRTPTGSEGINKLKELGWLFLLMIPAMFITMGIIQLMESTGLEWMYDLAGSTAMLVGAILWAFYTEWRRNVNNMN